MEPSPESGGDEPPPSAPEPDTGRSGRAPLVVALALLLVGVGVAVALVVGGDDSDNTASPTSTTAVTTTIAAPTTSGAATAPAAVDPVTGLPTGRFTIVGRQIVDPDGNVFVPMGANVAVRQLTEAQPVAVGQAHFERPVSNFVEQGEYRPRAARHALGGNRRRESERIFAGIHRVVSSSGGSGFLKKGTRLHHSFSACQ